jgi:curved DNA-binding protein CbpA
MLKKSGILLSCNNLHSLHSSGPVSKTSPPHLPGPRAQQQQHRQYAMVSDGYSRHDHGKLRWPEMTSANTIPTPYQIFNQKKGSPYSKKRFYELVKLYHPDRHDLESNDGIPYSTKLERYRLIIAANDILSDPVKRGAYDIYGAGWNGQPGVARPRDSSDPSSSWGNYGGRGWGGGPQGPSQNATWEDWERWYQRDAKGPQEPRFVSNSAFVGLIVIFAALGGIGQATRVGNFSVNFVEQRDALHNNISKDLIRRRKETSTYSSREERIDSFLRNRDPHGYGIADHREESYRKLLPTPEICSSEDIKQRKMDIYDQKNNPKDG